ncbi:MAG: phosphoenolpyruvate carboxykinase (ATP) [Pseudomonadota bacterium]
MTDPSLDAITHFLNAEQITARGAVHANLSFDALYEHEVRPSQAGCHQAHLTDTGAVVVYTGRFTGRSSKDKYLVEDALTRDSVWWKSASNGSDNQPMAAGAWQAVKRVTTTELARGDVYVMDLFCGTNPATRMAVRVVTTVAWAAHFAKNMFVRPDLDELEGFTPDWTVLHAPEAELENHAEFGMRSPVFAAFNLSERVACVGGTWYGGEIKKGLFSMMNYFLPEQGVGSFHCSANVGAEGDAALFFGLSGTGKTTLSTDPKRQLIGDDEHGWDDQGVFNFEGGCYAKTIDLSAETEPEIHAAIRRNALLENVPLSGSTPDYGDRSLTENTRVSYPLDHIDNIVRPVSRAGHPKNIIFLTCDAFGILPPVAKLSEEQAKYYYLNGYTAKVAGTELGLTEPTAAFSACFGGAFLTVHPTRYGKILGEKMAEHGSRAWLVNTGWSGGGYGVGRRMSLKVTRAIIDAIFDGSLAAADFEAMPLFDLAVPTAVAGVDPAILNPRNAWQDTVAYDAGLQKLAGMFVANFAKYTDTPDGVALAEAGPRAA